MEAITEQRPASSDPKAVQAPRSCPTVDRHPTRAPSTEPTGTIAAGQHESLTTHSPAAASSARSPSLDAELQEYFDGFVESVGEHSLQVRTVSRDGEEATAWLPIERIPEGERKYISVGAELRISILQERRGSRRHLQRIRFVRPILRVDREHVVDYLLQQMKAVLRGGIKA